MTRFKWIAWGCALPLLASAQESVVLAPSPLQLPAKLGPLRIDGEPHRFDSAPLGISYQYSGDGLSLTVYVYDAARENIPDGGDTTLACEQLEEARSGVESASYADIQLKSEQLVRLGGTEDMPLAREAVYEFVRDGQPTISYIWVTAVAKNFVKLRFSLDSRLRDEVPDARRAVLTELGMAMKPHLAPPTGAEQEKAKNSTTSLNVQMGANSEDMMAGIVYLGFLSSAVDQAPQLGPKCGGEFIPGFDVELSALRMVLALEEGEKKSAFGQLLARAQGAGFLEELAWFDMHRESWGTTGPPGLDIPGYQAWRKKNRKRFRNFAFGSVVVNHPRPLPVEVPAGL